MANVKINGRWLTDRTAFGELWWSSKYRGGSEAASWRVDSTRRLPYRPGQLVEVVEMGVPVFAGTLLEPDGDVFHARGLHYQAKRTHALDGAGDVTVIPDVAIDTGIGGGFLGWSRIESLSSAAFGSAAAPMRLDVLLDSWAEAEGRVWRVDGRGVVRASLPPTTPRWHVTPGASRMSVAEDSYVTHLLGRYLSTGTGAYATTPPAIDADAAARFGPRSEMVDLTGEGVALSAVEAEAIVANRLAMGAARPGWSTPLRLAGWELTTAGDSPANLREVRGGQMIRILGQMDMTIAAGVKPYIDVIADEVTYVDGSDFIEVKPVGLEVRGLEEALSASLSGER